MLSKNKNVVAVRFIKEHVLGRSNWLDEKKTFKPGEVVRLPRWQAQDLEAQGIVKVEKDFAEPKDKEAHVRARLATFDEAKIIGKLKNLGVTAKPGAPKVELVEMYVSAVRPKAEGKDEKNGRKEQKR